MKPLVASLWLCLCASLAHAEDTVTVLAAASLADALGEASARYEKEKGVHIRHSFAASSILARQIETGAPADIYISANEKWMDYLQEKKLVESASRRNWLGNRLVLVVPKGQAFPVRFGRDFDFAKAFAGRVCIGNIAAVPAGIYAKQSLDHFGWWDGIRQRIIETEDVRAALAFVEREECAAGIVYESDARISRKVEIAGVFPENSHTPIVYPIALVTGAQKMARDYWDYLQSPASEAILAKYGFRILR